MHASMAFALATAGLMVGPSPVEAAISNSSITFNASPEPLTAGGTVTLSGKAGYGNSNNASTVRFYFRRHNATTYTLITSTSTSSSGGFSKQTRHTTSGYWKAVYAGNAARRPVTSTVDYVEAKAWRNINSVRFTHHATASDYKSPVKTWYTDRSARVSAQVTCTRASEYNFLSVTWNGHPEWGFEHASFDFTGTSTSGASYIYPDQRTGYMEISTQAGCSWTVTVTQAVRAYVKV